MEKKIIGAILAIIASATACVGLMNIYLHENSLSFAERIMYNLSDLSAMSDNYQMMYYAILIISAFYIIIISINHKYKKNVAQIMIENGGKLK